MTALTLMAVAAFMLVVLFMAGDAGVRGHDLLGHRLAMAIVTPDSLMAAVELEFRAGVMIEVPNLPIARIVAVFAGLTKSPSMRVIILMAGITVGWSLFFVEMSGVAAFASRGAVGAKKRVLGISLMAEEDGLPGVLAVAFLALLSESASMNVVFLMAAITICRRFVLVEKSLVATLAFGFSMVSL